MLTIKYITIIHATNQDVHPCTKRYYALIEFTNGAQIRTRACASEHDAKMSASTILFGIAKDEWHYVSSELDQPSRSTVAEE